MVLHLRTQWTAMPNNSWLIGAAVYCCWIRNKTGYNDDIIGFLPSLCELLYYSPVARNFIAAEIPAHWQQVAARNHTFLQPPAFQTPRQHTHLLENLILFVSHAGKFVIAGRNYPLECHTVPNLYSLKRWKVEFTCLSLESDLCDDCMQTNKNTKTT